MTKKQRIAELERRVSELESRLLYLEAVQRGQIQPYTPYPSTTPPYAPTWVSDRTWPNDFTVYGTAGSPQ